jgi:hypothetical protein
MQSFTTWLIWATFFLKNIGFQSKSLVNFTKTVGKYLNLGLVVFETRINDLKESVEK